MGRKIGIFFILVGLVFSAALVLKRGKWDRYYKNKMHQPPHELIQKVAAAFQSPGRAIDLGCGVGNEATFLIKNGWQVFAIDSQPKAIQILQSRGDPDKLVTLTAKFDEGLDWDALPSSNLVCASYSLPFCKPQEFHKVWEQIKSKIEPEGRFAGHFFGHNYQGYTQKEKSQMTFLTREQIEDLFKDFEIEYLREYEEDGKSGTGNSIHSHIFDIIAIKPNEKG